MFCLEAGRRKVAFREREGMLGLGQSMLLLLDSGERGGLLNMMLSRNQAISGRISGPTAQ
jgi:hypothetical protein